MARTFSNDEGLISEKQIRKTSYYTTEETCTHNYIGELYSIQNDHELYLQTVDKLEAVTDHSLHLLD